MKYDPQKIEKKWQKAWEKDNIAEDSSKKPKQYILIELPYPSGEGLHVGHVRSYSALDVIARKRRMQGFNVLYPVGWDAFGLPTENYALKTGIHPQKATEKNVANFKRQLKSLGLSFDWTREINTTDPDYYKWTQWIFLKLFEKGLAYQAKIPVNWCPSCKIGLANEEVVEGRCERCKTEVEQKELKQWMLRITKYADRLIKDLEKVDFLEKIKIQQINWIGRSSGTEVCFLTGDQKIKVFTTRIDTIFGVTAIVLAPEHPLVKKLVNKNYFKKVEQYIQNSQSKTEFERTKLEKEKTGVFTGSYAINPANREKVPIWVGDYVVAAYGGGAVMVVPAHDKRDYEMAKKHGLKIKKVVQGGKDGKAFCDYGKLINSGRFNGLSSEKAIKEIAAWLCKKSLARQVVKYRLRDWVFSRQHYWGEPIPIIHCPKCGIVPVPEKDLPVKLPHVEKYQPSGTGESPLAKIKDWVNVRCPQCKGKAKRETDTMPNWAGSNWYYLRYCDPKNSKELASYKKLEYWMPIDWYNGGMEHTTLHLLYSRFIYKFLYDIKAVPCSEPYAKRTSHGMVLAEDGRKMSKSFNNVINPDEIVNKYGADTLRIYEMFIGPFDQAIAWSAQGVKGAHRFLNKAWNLVLEADKSSSGAVKAINELTKKIDEDIEKMKFNTTVSAFMEFLNFVSKNKADKKTMERFLILLAPFAPHFSEELWHILGHKKSIFLEKWPQYDSKKIKIEKIELIIQINGKVRDKIKADYGLSQKEAEKMSLSQEKIKKWTNQKKIKKIFFIPNKLINIVV